MAYGFPFSKRMSFTAFVSSFEQEVFSQQRDLICPT